MTREQNGMWAEMLGRLGAIVALTSDGEIALLKKIANAEDFIVTCLVAQFVAHKAGKTNKETLGVNEILAAGGLAYRPARQTIYNSTSALAKSRIILKDGNEFKVAERVVVQYFGTKLPALLGDQNQPK